MKNILNKKEDALVMRLAWPCVIENLSATLVSLVDTAMVGSLGAVATAAVGVCASPSWLMNGLVQALGVGGTALVARAIGAGERAEAEHTGRQVFKVAVLMALLIMAVMFFGAPLIPIIMSAKPEVHADAAAYMRIVSCCYLFHYTGMAMGALLRGAGDTKTSMISGIMANALNIVGNYFLIYQTRPVSLLGLRFTMYGAGLGVRGAAAASAGAMGVAALYVLIHMFGKKSALRVGFSFKERWDGSTLKRVFRIGLPAALERVAINLGQMLFAAMIASVGTIEVAAYHIAINVEGLGYMPAYGFSAAATTLVGQKLGAKAPDEAEKLGKRCVALSLVLLTAVGAVMYLASGALAAVFSPDPAVVAIAAAFIAICAVEQPFNAVSIVVSGALRGAGDTVMPFVYGLITMWGVRILGAWLFGLRLNMGVLAICWAMVADLGVRSLLLWGRFLHGKWKHMRV